VSRIPNVVAAALSLDGPGAAPVAEASVPLKVLFDSSCAVCLTNKALLTALDRKRSKLEFVDILAFPGPGYVAPSGEIITKEEAMRHIHVIGPGTKVTPTPPLARSPPFARARHTRPMQRPCPWACASPPSWVHPHNVHPPSLARWPSPQVAKGADAVLSAYEAVGLGWFVAVLRLPILSWFINRTYTFVSKHRYTISKLVPPFLARRLFSGVSSLNQMSSAAKGLGCDDEEECELPYDDAE